MRNLKRALSLTLASVMLLGMMVVGSSAAGYPDVSEEENIEAIEVLQSVGVMEGDNNGNFNPDDYVTREQMAVIMSKLLNLDYNYYQGTNPFSDVPAWAAPYVAACAANGITSGIGGGMYGAGQNVNAVQAALMMLKALGYFQYQADFGDSYILATVKQATEIGLFKQIDSNAQQALTRNEVAQMALNALKADMVTFTGDVGIELPNVGNVGYKSEYTPRTSTLAKYQAIEERTSDVSGGNNLNRGQYYIQLGEELYDGELKLNSSTTDVFGRPSRYWEYKGKEIGTYAKMEQIKAEYTKKVTGKDLYDLLGKAVVEDSNYSIDVFIDGWDSYDDPTSKAGVSTHFNRTAMNKNNKEGVGGTGNGVLTQVFVDGDKKEVTVAIINTYLARAKADYSEKKDETSLAVYNINHVSDGDGNKMFYKAASPSKEGDTMIVAGEDFPIAVDARESDAFLVTVADGEIQSMVDPKVISSTEISAFNLDSWVEADGVKYDYNTTVEYDPEVLENWTGASSSVNLKDRTYNVYLDAYGYLIGVELVDKVDNYVFITGVESESSPLSAKNYQANAIFLDGTMDTITVNAEKSSDSIVDNADNMAAALVNTWCTYTVNSNNIYTLTEVAGPDVNGDSQVGTGVGSAKIKVGQYHDLMDDNSNGDTGVYSETNEINVKRVSLRGGAGHTVNDFKYVYGNDASVYLNAQVKGIKVNSAGTVAGVISKVSSMTTGINETNLEILDEPGAIAQAKKNSASKLLEPASGKVSMGAYVLYNDKGYVIAAVTVASDAVSSDNLVYVNSSGPNRESYDKTNDEWTWTREVIHNGEKITLTEVSDGISVLSNMAQHNWYVVSYNGKGNVIAADHAADELIPDEEYEDEINELEDTINAGKQTVLFENSLYNGLDNNVATDGDSVDHSGYNKSVKSNNGPELRGSTFYREHSDRTGFYVDNSVKLVFIQKTRNEWNTTLDTGKTALENVVKNLNEEQDQCVECGSCAMKYHYEVSAIITNGRAQVVVIRDLHATGDSGNHDDGNNGITVTVGNGKVDVDLGDYTGIGDDPGEVGLDDVVKAIENELKRQGYTEPKVTVVRGVITKIEAKKGITVYEFERTGDIADPRELTAVGIKTQPTEKTYIVGEAFNPVGMVLNLTYSDSATPVELEITNANKGDVTLNLDGTSPDATSLKTDNTEATVTYAGVTSTDKITSIDVNAAAAEYELTLPAGVTASWDRDAAAGVAAGTLSATGDVPEGASVKVTAAAGNTWYVKVKTEYVAPGDESAAFTMGGAADSSSVSADKYYKIARDVTINGADGLATELGGLTVTATTGANDSFVKDGDTITVTFVAAGGTATDSIKGSMAAVIGLTAASTTTPIEIVADAGTSTAVTESVTVGSTIATAEVTLSYTLSV